MQLQNIHVYKYYALDFSTDKCYAIIESRTFLFTKKVKVIDRIKVVTQRFVENSFKKL